MQEVAFVVVQLRVETPPCAIEFGVAVRVSVGDGVGGETVTVALPDPCPPIPVQVSE
jgi:hypothetical protein